MTFHLPLQRDSAVINTLRSDETINNLLSDDDELNDFVQSARFEPFAGRLQGNLFSSKGFHLSPVMARSRSKK